jgi:hypothetical protein
MKGHRSQTLVRKNHRIQIQEMSPIDDPNVDIVSFMEEE